MRFQAGEDDGLLLGREVDGDAGEVGRGLAVFSESLQVTVIIGQFGHNYQESLLGGVAGQAHVLLAAARPGTGDGTRLGRCLRRGGAVSQREDEVLLVLLRRGCRCSGFSANGRLEVTTQVVLPDGLDSNLGDRLLRAAFGLGDDDGPGRRRGHGRVFLRGGGFFFDRLLLLEEIALHPVRSLLCPTGTSRAHVRAGLLSSLLG